jgi:hypothetical protein
MGQIPRPHPFYGRGKRNEEKGSKGSVGVRVEEWKECGKNRRIKRDIQKPNAGVVVGRWTKQG